MSSCRSPGAIALTLSGVLSVVIALGSLAVAPTSAGLSTGTHPSLVDTEPDERRAAPRLRVRTVVAGLENPWDVQSIGGGSLLVTERDKARLSIVRRGERRTVRFPRSRVWVSGETGLMSLAIDPRFKKTMRFWTCQGWRSAGGHDVRVSLWKLSASKRRAQLVKHVVTGIPTTSGRHGGCRLLLDSASKALFIGTGDAADPRNPRNLTSLGGKVMRVHRRTGAPLADNPYADAEDARQRIVYTYGHRNVQGLAQRRGGGAVVSVEHGSFRDDEVNALSAGADFGWNPGPGYDESVPMTDQSLPGEQTEAIWSSGDPTIATSGAAWTSGADWGRYESALAVAALGGERMLLIRFDETLRQADVRTPAVMRRYGRLRSVTSLADGDLLVTTSNGRNDRILRVSPR